MSFQPVNPDGPVPFWFWNGLQTEAEITRQVTLAAAGGLRGLAIHARAGNRVPYLSDHWLLLVRHACVQAREQGLEIWIYDEDGYPSGTAANSIQARRPDLVQSFLSFRHATATQACREPRRLRVFAAADPDLPVDPAALPPETEVLLFSVGRVGRYVDTLRPETARLFLELTHERYRTSLGEFFGNPITAFYTDDVNYLMEFAGGLPYTPGLEPAFRERFGAGLLDRLPLLVEDLPGSRELRIQYRQLLQELFLRHFVRPVRDWCARHGLFLTGHLRGDEGPFTRAVNQFSSAMPFHAAEDVPGIDDYLLRLPDGCYASHVRNPLGLYPLVAYKQAASVANQLKGGRCGVECLTSLGWGVSLEETVRQLRFELFMGMNLLSPHACSYSTAGVAKSDHPPSYFFQQPWWPMMPDLLQRLGALGRLLQRGRHAADVLVLHPATSAWAMTNGADLNPGFKPRHAAADGLSAAGLEREFAELTLHLFRLHAGFDYGDEELLVRSGRVEAGPARLAVGDMAYRTVVIPPVVEMMETTLVLLRNFLAAGGRVIALVPEARWKALPDLAGAAVVRLGADWRPALAGLLVPDLVLADAAGAPLPEVMVHTRVVEGQREFNLLNLQPHAAAVRLPESVAEKMELIDPELDVKCGPAVAFTLPPFGCAHLRPAAGPPPVLAAACGSLLAPGAPPAVLATVAPDAWTVTPQEDNVLHFDSVLLPSGDPLPLREWDAVPPGTGEVELRVDLPPGTTAVRLASEQLCDCRVTANGVPLPAAEGRLLPMSQDLQAVSLGGFLHEGVNRMTVRLPTPPPVRLEDFYLFGSFAVRFHGESGRGRTAQLAPLPPLALGNLAEQGLPFYWGTVCYRTVLTLPADVRPGWLDLGAVEGAVQVVLNGSVLPLRTGPPWRYGLAGRWRSGEENRLEIRLANTPQNFFGAPRRSGGHPPAAGASPAGEAFPAAPRFGLFGPVRLLAPAGGCMSVP